LRSFAIPAAVTRVFDRSSRLSFVRPGRWTNPASLTAVFPRLKVLSAEPSRPSPWRSLTVSPAGIIDSRDECGDRVR